MALDSRDGEVLSHGWRRSTDKGTLERIEKLKDLCGGFLVTFVELEGRLEGTDLDRAEELVNAAGDCRVTIAGGVSTSEEVARLDRIGADAQVGMALYTGQLTLSDALTAMLSSERADGLWPTVVVDEQGTALGLAWSSAGTLALAVEGRKGVYESRSRGTWIKGETSGATQDLLKIDLDCDRDALRFTVRQHGSGFCHTGQRTCWGDDDGVGRLARRLAEMIKADNPASNTQRLFRDPDLLAAKLREEAGELAVASTPKEVIQEAADLLYFLLVKTTSKGVWLDEVETELAMRERRVTHRPMVPKDDHQ